MLDYKDFLEFGRECGILFTDVQIGSKCLVSEKNSWIFLAVEVKSYKSLSYCSIWMKISIYTLKKYMNARL